jgi:hypothetical protein
VSIQWQRPRDLAATAPLAAAASVTALVSATPFIARILQELGTTVVAGAQRHG